MARPPKSTHNPSRKLSADDCRTGIVRLRKRLEELNAFDVNLLQASTSPELTAIETSILDTLAKVFGANTFEFDRYKDAASLAHQTYIYFSGMPATPISEKRDSVRNHIGNSRALLESAIKSLEEDLPVLDAVPPVTAKEKPMTRAIFLVHGHDEGVRESVARFLEQIDFQVIILHEKASRGRTVIEKVESHGDVGFAVVLLTPDDQGGVEGGAVRPRARQNVILELGYFVGRLGRERVCALMKGDVEIPSDFSGVVYQPFDSGGGWKQALAKELRAAGYAIDWNLVMP